MRVGLIPILVLLGLSEARAEPEPALPRFDVEQGCTRFVGSADPRATMRNLCIEREQRAYAASMVLWREGMPAERTQCAEIAERSRSYKYVYLATCLRSTARARSLRKPTPFRY